MPPLYRNTDLTSKEWAIAALVSKGYTNTEIAAETQTREQLVEDCLRRIFQKTGCWNRSEMALWYLKLGLEGERRLHDRREATSETSDERRKADRRDSLEPAPRAHEQHEINLDE
jgi:DNA-binding CsgD family transcriptional regulator